MENKDLINTPKVVGEKIESKNVEFNEDIIVLKNPTNIESRSYEKYNINPIFQHGVIVKDKNRAPESTDIYYSDNINYPIGSLWIYNNDIWLLSSINTVSSTADWIKLDEMNPSDAKFSDNPSSTYEVYTNKYGRRKKRDIYKKYNIIINNIQDEVFTTEIHCLACAGSGCARGCSSGCSIGSCEGGCGNGAW